MGIRKFRVTLTVAIYDGGELRRLPGISDWSVVNYLSDVLNYRRGSCTLENTEELKEELCSVEGFLKAFEDNPDIKERLRKILYDGK